MCFVITIVIMLLRFLEPYGIISVTMCVYGIRFSRRT
jgi:hypothetical protein